jgi:pimeloyl-ACP methyl ester carboxylesterase
MNMPIFQAEGAQIHYEDLGAGDPLLLIHGAAASGRWFDRITPSLARTHRTVIPDLRGLGKSQRVAPLTRPQVWIEDILGLLDHLGLDRVDMLGVSLGSRVAGRLALSAPERVTSLIVDAPIIGMSSGGSASLDTTFTTVDPASEQAQEWRLLHGEDWADAVAFYAQTRSTPEFQSYFTLEQELGAIGVPTLICRGDHDDAIHPLANAFTWHRDAPSTALWIAPGLSQSSTIQECPEAFLSAVEQFEKQHRPALSV